MHRSADGDGMAVDVDAEVAGARRPAGRALPRLRSFVAWLWPAREMAGALPALDGLRGIAVLLVVLFHAWYYTPQIQRIVPNDYLYAMDYGRTGVQLFFVLSGFLLFLPYARWLFAIGPRPSTRLFYKRRILRVGPAYWVSVVVLVALTPFSWSLVASALAHVVFLHNVFYDPNEKINSVYWTMAVEVQFYVLLPAIGWSVTHVARRGLGPLRAAALVLGGLTLFSVVCVALDKRTVLGGMPVVSTALVDSYALPYWLSVFAAGMACSVAYIYLTQAHPLDAPTMLRVRNWTGALCAAGVAGALGIAVVPWLRHLPLKDQVFGWAYGAVLLGILLGPEWMRRPFEARALRFAGWVSYSLYLWHLPILMALEPRLSAFTSVPARALAGFALDLVLALPTALLSFQLTERPFFPARKRARKTEAALTPKSRVGDGVAVRAPLLAVAPPSARA